MGLAVNSTFLLTCFSKCQGDDPSTKYHCHSFLSNMKVPLQCHCFIFRGMGGTDLTQITFSLFPGNEPAAGASFNLTIITNTIILPILANRCIKVYSFSSQTGRKVWEHTVGCPITKSYFASVIRLETGLVLTVFMWDNSKTAIDGFFWLHFHSNPGSTPAGENNLHCCPYYVVGWALAKRTEALASYWAACVIAYGSDMFSGLLLNMGLDLL